MTKTSADDENMIQIFRWHANEVLQKDPAQVGETLRRRCLYVSVGTKHSVSYLEPHHQMQFIQANAALRTGSGTQSFRGWGGTVSDTNTCRDPLSHPSYTGRVLTSVSLPWKPAQLSLVVGLWSDTDADSTVKATGWLNNMNYTSELNIYDMVVVVVVS